jgi:hypothetical protein
MKISLPSLSTPSDHSVRSFRYGIRAMSLAELMVSLAVFTLVFGGLLSVTIFGMRQDELTNSQLGANDQARLSFNLMLDEIRSSKNVQIGYGSYTNFTALTNGLAQQGSTLQIIPSTNLNVYIYYYFETNAGTLWRASASNGAILSSNVVCTWLTNVTSQWLTNSMCFRAMDYTGTTNLTVDPTNYNFNYVVNVLLQFYQFQYPQTMIGSNLLYTYYQLTYSATRRSP